MIATIAKVSALRIVLRLMLPFFIHIMDGRVRISISPFMLHNTPHGPIMFTMPADGEYIESWRRV